MIGWASGGDILFGGAGDGSSVDGGARLSGSVGSGLSVLGAWSVLSVLSG